MAIPLTPREEMDFILQEMAVKRENDKEDTRYLPPSMEGDFLRSGLMVSEVVVVKDKVAKHSEEVAQAESQEVTEKKEESVDNEDNNDVVADEELMINNEEEVGEKFLAVENDEDASDYVEVEGVTSEGSAREDELMVNAIGCNVPRTALAQATAEDKTLQVVRGLAREEKHGYRQEEGIVFRSRLNDYGSVVEQICLPTAYRQKCLQLAHTKFGHQGRNKMVSLIRPYFYWPSLTSDCLNFIKGCTVCQLQDKKIPPRSKMRLREIVSIPFERMAVDLVGPFPTATGGFRFLLTVIDLATRWPEAIPLRTTTSKIVMRELTSVFSRCGFPTALVSDNGPQFRGKSFRKWLQEKGIQHVQSSPYHPQGNGVVERLHRTLNAMVAKTAGSKGNWAAVVSMALYFIRASPCESTGISLFLARQGWEPSTPIQLLYKAWAQQDLGSIDLEEWVMCNSERVENEREKSELQLRKTAEARKKEWDKRAKERELNVNDEVLLRKPGLNFKLQESWEGPYTVKKKNSPLSYAIDTGERVIPSVHI